jgi:hypothetical protein
LTDLSANAERKPETNLVTGNATKTASSLT